MIDNNFRLKQQLAALTMIPGIFMSIYYIIYSQLTAVKVAAACYIIICMGSITYHTKCAHDLCVSKSYLRFDIFCQQIGLYIPFAYAYGIRFLLILAPLITMIFISKQRIATIIHFSILLTIGLFYISRKVFVIAVIALATFFIPSIYNLSIWHILAHIAMKTVWDDYTTAQKMTNR